MTVYIYVMIDPRTGDVRYVGKTVRPHSRFRDHVRYARQGRERSHKAKWVRQLLDLGLRPIFRIVKDTNEEEWREDERTIIRVLRANGAPLTNISEGGDGEGHADLMHAVLAELYRETCRRGHPWTPQTTIIQTGSSGRPARTCRACKRLRNNRRYRQEHPEPYDTETCRRGHPYTDESTAMVWNGTAYARRCRICSNADARARKARKSRDSYQSAFTAASSSAAK